MSELLKVTLSISLLILCGWHSTVLAADPASLRFVFQKQKDPALIREQADHVGKFLSKRLGIKVETHVPSDYAASVQALVSGKADIAYVDSIAFLLARRDGDAQVLLAEKRKDGSGSLRTDYDSIFVVHKDSPLKTIKDLISQASNLRMVFTSPTSTSGYVMPYRRLVNEGLLVPRQDPKQVFRSVGFGGSYTQALEEVIAGRGDVCAVSFYTMEGTSAESYLPQSKRDNLRVLARTSGVPTHVIVVRKGISEQFAAKVKEALLQIAKEQPELLTDVYGTSEFSEVDEDQHVRASVEAMDLIGIPVEKFLKPTKG